MTRALQVRGSMAIAALLTALAVTERRRIGAG